MNSLHRKVAVYDRQRKLLGFVGSNAYRQAAKLVGYSVAFTMRGPNGSGWIDCRAIGMK